MLGQYTDHRPMDDMGCFIFWEWHPIKLYGDYFINHDIKIPIKQPSIRWGLKRGFGMEGFTDGRGILLNEASPIHNQWKPFCNNIELK